MNDDDDLDDDLGLRDWAVPAPPDRLVDQVIARVEGTGVHPAAAREPLLAGPSPARTRRAGLVVALLAAGGLVAVALIVPGRSSDHAATPTPAPGQLTAAAPSVITLAPGTVAEVDTGGDLAWRLDDDGALRVTQTAGAITFRHDGGRRLTVDAAFARVDAERATVRVEIPMTKQRKLAAGAIGAAVATAVVVACYQGNAGVSNAHGRVELGAGSTATVSPERAPTAAGDGEPVARTVPTAPRKLASAAARTAVLDELARARARREVREVREVRERFERSNEAADAAPAMDPTEIQTAVRQVAPMLGECFELAPRALQEQGGNVVAELTVVGEPEVGTVFEDATLSDGTAAMLADAEFSECVLETLLAVEMPPLPAGGKVIISYPFAFAIGEPDEEDEEDEPDAADEPAPGRTPAQDKKRAARSTPAPVPDVSAKQLVDQANDAARNGLYARALVLAEHALAQEPGNPQALTAAAIAACNLKDRKRAARFIGRLSDQRAAMTTQVCERNGVILPEP